MKKIKFIQSYAVWDRCSVVAVDDLTNPVVDGEAIAAYLISHGVAEYVEEDPTAFLTEEWVKKKKNDYWKCMRGNFVKRITQDTYGDYFILFDGAELDYRPDAWQLRFMYLYILEQISKEWGVDGSDRKWIVEFVSTFPALGGFVIHVGSGWDSGEVEEEDIYLGSHSFHKDPTPLLESDIFIGILDKIRELSK